MISKYDPYEFVTVPDGWECQRLIDCTDDKNISYGIVQPGQHIDDGIPIIRINNINNGQLELLDVLKVSPEVESKYQRTRLKGGEVLLTLVGSTGQSFVAPKELTGWNVPRAIAVIRVKKEIGADWVNLCLQSQETKHFLDVRANTTVQKTLNLKDVRDIPILIPPKRVKETIENLALSLSGKINLNTQTNQTLEAIAQAIFKSWFVDFEPVKAKMAALEAGGTAEEAERAAMCAISGKDEAALTQLQTEQPAAYAELAQTAALFPSAMQDSELGEIPEGWDIKNTESLAEKIAMGPFGSNIKVSTFVEQGVPIISGQHLNETLITDATSHNFITEAHAEKLKNSVVKPGDIVFTHAGNIGQVSLIPENSRYEKYVISQRQFYLRTNTQKSSAYFLVYFFRSFLGQHALLSNASQVGVPSIARPSTHLKSIELVTPTFDLMMRFEKKAKSLLNMVISNRGEVQGLSELRDTLLPKLLSGEIDLSQAADMAEEVSI